MARNHKKPRMQRRAFIGQIDESGQYLKQTHRIMGSLLENPERSSESIALEHGTTRTVVEAARQKLREMGHTFPDKRGERGRKKFVRIDPKTSMPIKIIDQVARAKHYYPNAKPKQIAQLIGAKKRTAKAAMRKLRKRGY